MSLFDSFFDPDQFQDSGGLLGRLLSLQPQTLYDPGAGFGPQGPLDGQAAPAPQMQVSLPAALPAPAAPLASDYGQAQNIAIDNYQMPQFGRADVTPQPDLGDRLSAGFQSWAHTLVGSPFAALANGLAGLNSGQRTDPAGIAQQKLQPGTSDPANASQDRNAQYQALRPVLGERNAMLAIVHPEFGKALIARALAGQRGRATPAT